MIAPSNEYAIRAASDVQDTIFVFRLTSLNVNFSTEEVNGLTSYALISERPSLAPSQVSPLTGTSSIGTMSFRIEDENSVVTELRAAYPILDKVYEVWIGYRGLKWDAYLRVLVGKVKKFELSDDGTHYSVEVSDYWSNALIQKFALKDMAAEPWSGTNKSWDNGSLILSHTEDGTPYVTLRGNPIDLFLKMMLSDGSLSGGYNVWPAWAGAGLDSTKVDVEWCEAERVKILPIEFQPVIDSAINVKNYAEIEFARALGGYSLLSGEGKLRLHYPSTPLKNASLPSVTDDHIIKRPVRKDPYNYYMSHVRIEFDYEDGGFQTEIVVASPEYLEGTYSTEREHHIASMGMRSSLGGVSVAYTTAYELFKRYGNPAPEYSLQLFFSRHLIEPGDVFTCVSDYIKNTDNRGKGATRYFEALVVKPMGSYIEIDAIDLTGPNTAPPTAIIAPNGQNDYNSASDVEKEYAYISDAATGKFDNGGPSYVFG